MWKDYAIHEDPKVLTLVLKRFLPYGDAKINKVNKMKIVMTVEATWGQDLNLREE